MNKKGKKGTDTKG